MSKETWIEIIVGSLIITLLGYLSSKVLDMNGTLSGVDARVTSTSARVERIANALPDMGVRVAQEEVNRPIQTMVVSSETEQNRGQGQNKTVISVIDVKSSNAWTLSLMSSSAEDKKTLAAMAWAGASRPDEYVSFATMQSYAKEASINKFLPAYVDENTSFILRSTSAEEYLKEISELVPPLKKKKTKVKIDNWKDVAESLKENKRELSEE